MRTIVLASNSPRRKDLLEQAGIPFVVDAEEIDEGLAIGDPAELTAELSERKAYAVLRRHPDEWVLGADTVVYYDGEILGKPEDAKEAFDMLCMLSGRAHEVVTGVTLLRMNAECGIHKVQFSERTRVRMYDHRRDVIKSYVATGEPLDKAGAYGIQGKGAILVERIEGDYNNVVGLPVARVYRELLELEMLDSIPLNAI